MYNVNSLTTLCASLCDIMGIDAPKQANEKNSEFVNKVKSKLGGEVADKIIMYNPDAIAEWVYKKYPYLLQPVIDACDIEVPMKSVMPSVTPVCFGTMYTGAEPSVHGIQAYVKPVISIDTIFDALIRAGKKPVIISIENASLSKIYLERDMDYFIYPTVEKVLAKAVEVILSDSYDFIVIYDISYDKAMHKNGTESIISLSQLQAGARAFGMINELIANNLSNYNVLLGFAMDHGCHDIDGGCGSHGLDMEEDLNICHLYSVKKRANK